jgi:branched-chain amino acid transport system substrate-binding protein
LAGLLATVGIGWFSAVAADGVMDEPEPVLFGIVVPQTGAREAHGMSILAGMQVRARKINAAGGVLGGRPVVFEIIDTESNTERAAEAVTELARRPEVLAILGPHNSGEFAAMLAPALKGEIPVIAPKATRNGLTRDNPWAFRITFSNGFQGVAMARFLVENRGLTRFALFADGRPAYRGYTGDLVEDFRAAALERGAEIVADLSFDEGAADGQTDYRPALREIALASPDALFIPAYADEIQAIVRQAGEIGFSAVLAGGDSWDIEEVFLGAGARLVGSYFVASFSVASDDPDVRAFVESMHEAGMEFPDSSAALGYDAVTVAALALERAEAPTRAGFRDALLTLADIPLVTGLTTITPDGEAIKSVHIMQVVRDGKGHPSTVEVKRLDP